MNRLLTLALASLATAAAVAATTAPASARACQNGVCASSTDDGRTINVYLSNSMSGTTHYNVRRGSNQFESRGRFNFAVRSGYTYYYSVQACRRGGTFQRSFCTAWASFKHSVD